jgi:hypothetical protein
VTVLAAGVGDLLEVVLVSLLAGLGVTVVFAVAILGAVRARDARREHRGAAEWAWHAVSLAALLGVAMAVLGGLWVIAS